MIPGSNGKADVQKIILLMDNLKTYKETSLYKRCLLQKIRRIIKKLETHYTLKHGCWFAIAEIELNIMTKQCLSHRIAPIGLLRKKLFAWEAVRNISAAE